MGFSLEQGYIPVSVETIISAIREEINTQFGTSYTVETFVGTNFYKYFYALAQRVQTNEIKTSEIFLKLQQYIDLTNERILRPAVTNPGLIEAFAASDYLASVKPTIEADAGKVFVCVDVDELAGDYATKKLEICTIIKDSVVAGVVSMGTEEEAIVLSNGQSFDFKFNLPNRIETLLRLTITTSENNMVFIQSPENIKNTLLANIAARYALGKNFEPQRYFSLADAPWASQVVLEYSIDAGVNWETEVYNADYDDLLTIDLADITLIEN